MLFLLSMATGMMDAAKVADLVLLMIDGSFGLEMETFEFLNLLQVGGVMLSVI
jgi:ribosome biogenesis protein BMS1